MSSSDIATLIKMLESLPEPQQNRVVEHLRDYIQNLQDELQWDDSFQKTQQQLVVAARRAKQQIAEGQARPLDPDEL